MRAAWVYAVFRFRATALIRPWTLQTLKPWKPETSANRPIRLQTLAPYPTKKPKHADCDKPQQKPMKFLRDAYASFRWPPVAAPAVAAGPAAKRRFPKTY